VKVIGQSSRSQEETSSAIFRLWCSQRLNNVSCQYLGGIKASMQFGGGAAETLLKWSLRPQVRAF